MATTGAKCNYLENAVINLVLRNTAVTQGTAWLALHSGDPGEAGTANELSGNGYARIAVTFGAPTDGVATNSAKVTFAAASGSDWAEVTWMTLCDAETVGNRLYKIQADTARTVHVGEYYEVAIGALSVTET